MSDSITFAHELDGPSDAPVILFLHGFMGRRSDWRTITADLSNQFRCLTLDLPGHGETIVSGADDQFRMEPTAKALIGLLDSLEMGRCHLIGYSMGGRLGWYLALHYPERFDKVALESTTPGLASAAEREERRRHDETLAKKLETLPYEQFLAEWYDQPLFATMHRYPERFADMLASRRENDPIGLARSLRKMGTGAMPELWPLLEKVGPALSSRLLLITGSEDAKFRQIAERVAMFVPGIAVRTVDGCGHSVHFENPGEYVSLVRDFLTE